MRVHVCVCMCVRVFNIYYIDNFDQFSRDACWQYFASKCMENLHVVLSMSPSGDILRTRCRNFPGLVNNTYIDWMFSWPKQALYAVALRFLKDVS